jgi:hypothetical protein
MQPAGADRFGRPIGLDHSTAPADGRAAGSGAAHHEQVALELVEHVGSIL